MNQKGISIAFGTWIAKAMMIFNSSGVSYELTESEDSYFKALGMVLHKRQQDLQLHTTSNFVKFFFQPENANSVWHNEVFKSRQKRKGTFSRKLL